MPPCTDGVYIVSKLWACVGVSDERERMCVYACKCVCMCVKEREHAHTCMGGCAHYFVSGACVCVSLCASTDGNFA